MPLSEIPTANRRGTVVKTSRAPVRRTLTVALSALLPVFAAGALRAQTGGSVLTLEQAIDQAVHNNPGFLAQQNDQASADWGVRTAYGAFLPSASANAGLSYQKSGVQRIEGTTLDFGVQGTDYLSSNYSLGIGWGLTGDEVFGLSTAKANAAATSARIDDARFNLELAVTRQFMAALRAKDAMDVTTRRFERAQRNLDLVSTRVDAGASAGIDRKQAEVDLGRAEVAKIQAERALRTERLRLGEQLGTPLGENVTLESAFSVFEPTWTADELLAEALATHPSLRADIAQEEASRAGVRQARSQYVPSVSLQTGFSGSALEATSDDYLLTSAASSQKSNYDRCRQWQDVGGKLGVTFPGYSSCGSPDLSEDAKTAILDRNAVFPFDFTKSPMRFSFGVSLPVFNGFNRERSQAIAEASLHDASYNRRAEELRIRTAVTDQLDGLKVAYRVVAIEAKNREVAEDRLNLARQRYALGAASVFELLDAETSMSVAEGDALNAQYDFHTALVALEAAAGRTLRPAAR
jgi:outer membrane protein